MSLPSLRNRFIIGGLLAACVIVVAIAIQTPKAISRVVSGAPHNSDKLTIVKENTKAVFPYLVPKPNSAYQFDPESTLFDQTKGIVKYNVILKDKNTKITISQQKLPEELRPVPDSAKFNQFILASNVNYSLSIAGGKVFFRMAQQNGAPASGATTVIFATNDVLLFGQSGDILSYEKWSKLLGEMVLTNAR
jgi:hypothetical protein